jgi:hypothetical protein
MGSPNPKEIASNTARDLAQLVGDLNRTKDDARLWLADPEYGALRQRLEAAHAVVEATLIEARKRLHLSKGRGR